LSIVKMLQEINNLIERLVRRHQPPRHRPQSSSRSKKDHNRFSILPPCHQQTYPIALRRPVVRLCRVRGSV
jgi:hypothetical protein